MGYKELLLRYEALSRALQQQLGLLPGAAHADGSSSRSGSPAGMTGLSTSPGHRSKGQQAALGFGSLVLTASDAGIGHARRVGSAPIPVAAPVRGAAGSAPGSADASPSGKWSPGGILQRISKGASAARRSITPPRDRSGGRVAAVADAAASAEAVSRSPNSSRAASPGGKAGQPFFSTLFGSPKNASAQQQAAEEQQAQAGSAAGEQQPGAAQPPVHLPLRTEPGPEAAEVAAAAPQAGSSPELSFDGGLLSSADEPGTAAVAGAAEGDDEPQHVGAASSIDQLLGGAPMQQQEQQQEQLKQQALPAEASPLLSQQEVAGSPQLQQAPAESSASDLIHLGGSRSSSQQAPAAAGDAALGPDLLLPLAGAGEEQAQAEGAEAPHDTSLI